jgi:hypothetical protein
MQNMALGAAFIKWWEVIDIKREQQAHTSK